MDDDRITLRIQETRDAHRVFSINAQYSDTVQHLKGIISDQSDLEDPYIRLIAAGQLLAPDTCRLADFKIVDQQTIHAVIVKAPPPSNTSTLPSTESDNEDDDDDILETGMRRRLLGFDRLRMTNNMEVTEVTAIRAYFRTSVDRFLESNPNLNAFLEAQEPNDVLVRRRHLEDLWMRAQGQNSEFQLNLGRTTNGNPTTLRRPNSIRAMGSDRDFVWGFLLGFFVGSIMLVWVWMPNIPHKQKLGILFGYCVNLGLNVFSKEEEWAPP